MTCIVGYIDNLGNIFMGGDSIGYGETTWSIIKDPKVFIKENMIFGFTSSFRMGQILKYCFKIPKHNKKLNDMEYLCTVFTTELIKTFEKEKLTIKNETTGEIEQGGCFLLGYCGHLYVISSNFQVLEDIKNYESVGCGEEFAKGALYVMEKDFLIKPEDKVKKALETASQFSLVKPPFIILKLEKNKRVSKSTNERF